LNLHHLGLKSERISAADVLALASNFVRVLFSILAVFTAAFVIAEPSLSKALAVHFEAFRLRALTSEALDIARLLLKQTQLGVHGHRGLLLNGLLPKTSCPAPC